MPTNDNDRQELLRDFAVRQHPELSDFRELIQGNTLDEVEASAVNLAQRLKPAPDNGPDARQLYGDPGAGGGGVPIQPAQQAKLRATSQACRAAMHGDLSAKDHQQIRKSDAKQLGDALATTYVRDMLVAHGKIRGQLSGEFPANEFNG